MSSTLLDSAIAQGGTAVMITDRAGRIEYVNARFAEMSGYAATEVIGRTPSILRSGQTPTEVYEEMWSRLLAGEEWRGELANQRKSGELFWTSLVASPVRDADGAITHFVTFMVDIDERERCQAEEQRYRRLQQVLSACNQALVHAEGMQSLVDAVCLHLVRDGGLPLASIGFADDAVASAVRLVASAGPAADYAHRFTDAERGRGTSGESIRRREIIVRRDLQTDLPWRDEARRYGLTASIALPLVHADQVYGVLRLYATSAEAFGDSEIVLLGHLADDVAFGLATIRTREQLDSQTTELAIRERAIESSRNGVMITRCDASGDNPIVYANPAFARITGYSPADVLGRNPRFLLGDNWDQPEIERLRDALRRGVEAEMTLRNVRRDGSVFWNDLSLSPVRDSHGRATHFISVFVDASDRVRYEQELLHQATHDTVTGLANRALLLDRIEQALAHAHRVSCKAAVLLLDIDRFKLINDSLGHAVGDGLLRTVAERLGAVVRKGDTIARVGSDSFVIVFPDVGDATQVVDIARKIDAELGPAFVVGRQEAFISTSIGFSIAPDDGGDADTLLRNAEAAMHSVKAQGGNGCRAYAQSMGEAARDRLSIEVDLRRGIERGELELYYQPKVRLRDGGLAGAEALIRWRHPQRGLVPPMAFIPLAEETGLIGAIGDWVVAEALRHLKSWTAQGLPAVRVAVNLSARQFREPGLLARIRAMLVESGVGPDRLELELTETMLMHRGQGTIQLLHDLHATGLSLAIDDFGTGYSSLSYLQRFPIDTLKIDRSFVMDLEESKDSRVLAATIVMMAKSLGKRVVAEGVETSGQADILLGAGCEVAQGFLYSRPVPVAEFTEILRRGSLVQLPPQPLPK